MIGLISRHSTIFFRPQSQISRIAIGVAFVRAGFWRKFSSNTVTSIMASSQQAVRPKRKVGKKFVIACDGESLTEFLGCKQWY
jgi:hypothetical protein